MLLEKIAYAATDASIDNGDMEGHWCIKDSNQNILLQHELYHEE